MRDVLLAVDAMIILLIPLFAIDLLILGFVLGDVFGDDLWNWWEKRR